ncbi:MAG: phenylalanine--tRNA ligase subunit beta [Planctomycetota bacterium]
MKLSLNWLRDYISIDVSPAELPSFLMRAGLGTEGFEQVGDDVVFELETTSNRPDHLGHIGVARELSWILGVPWRRPDPTFATITAHEGKSLSEWLHLNVDEDVLCPYYVARMLVDVQVAPSPPELRRRIESIGLRPVNNVVDITNFVLFECGQPLHAFDYQRLRGGALVVRCASQGERLTAINAKSYDLDREDLVIADTESPVALAGIMGGLSSEVSAGTTMVALESAWFDPVRVRSTSRKLALASDASYRFERRVDPEGVDWASRRFCQLLQQIAGARVLENRLEETRVGFLEAQRPRVRVRPSRVARTLGVEIGADDIRRHLGAMGFEAVGGDAEALEFRVPSYRGDVSREIDLVEEVARGYGFDRIPEGRLTVQVAAPSESERHTEAIKSLLMGLGYREALTFSFVEAGECAVLEHWWSPAAPFEVRNPMRAPDRFLRRSLLPNLLAAVRDNRHHGVENVALFEIAHVFHRQPGQQPPHQSTHLAWAALTPNLDLRDMKGVVEVAFGYLGVARPSWVPLPDSVGLLDGAGFDDDGRRAGLLGAFRLQDLHDPVWCGEVDLGRYLGQAVPRTYQEFSRWPAIRRDLNLVFGDTVTWGQIERAVSDLELDDLIAIEFVDVYRGKQIDAGKKSVTFSLLYQSQSRTLTHEEADERTERAVRRLGERFSAVLRGP